MVQSLELVVAVLENYAEAVLSLLDILVVDMRPMALVEGYSGRFAVSYQVESEYLVQDKAHLVLGRACALHDLHQQS